MNFKRLLLTVMVSSLSLFLVAREAIIEGSNSTSFTMAKSDYQIIVDYVNANLTNTNSHPDNSDDYYGASAYYSNFNIKNGSYSASFSSPEVAIEEALSTVLLPSKYASSALNDKYEVNYATYSGSASQGTMRFVCSSVSPLTFTVFVPQTLSFTMDSLAYQSLVDYVNSNLTNTHDYPANSENYYGTSAFYKNFDGRSGNYSSSFTSSSAAIAAVLAEVYLPMNYADASQEDTYTITFNTYDGTAAVDSMTFTCSTEDPLTFTLVEDETVPSGDFESLTFGTDSTFDVVSWNIEHFPTNGTVTMEKVKAVIIALEPEVMALQEIDDTDKFTQMMSELDDYEAIIGDYGYAPMCFVYKKSSVTINDVSQLFKNDNSSFPREPLVVDLNFQGEQYIVVGNHLKCCGDGTLDESNSSDEENRRLKAMTSLKEHMDTNWGDKKVIVVGDYNDELDDDVADNIFTAFINDADNYKFADMDIALGSSNNWSYPSWPSHLDHILITNELFENSTAEMIRVDDHITWSVYNRDISDHRPVGFKFFVGKDTSVIAGIQHAISSTITIRPNPVDETLQVNGLPSEDDLSVMLYSNSGELLLSQESLGRVSLPIDMTAFSSGLYLLLVNGETAQFSQKVIKK